MTPGLPASPYVGLVPFTERDAPFFFGRETERRLVAANLLASRLTVLYGASGVGKSSLLGAGIERDFAERARQAVAAGRIPSKILVVFKDWQMDPVAGLADSIATAVESLLGDRAPTPVPPQDHLDELLAEWLHRLDARALELADDADRPPSELLIILDQFEEYFLYHGAEEGEASFAVEFPRAIEREGLRANFLLSIREDAYAQLDRFEAEVPSLLGSNFRLEQLSRDAARAAAVKPIDEYNRLHRLDSNGFAIEPELVEAVLTEVEAGKLALGSGGVGTATEAGETGGRIETPYLQLVLNRLWEEEQRDGSRLLRSTTFEQLGRAKGIVATHLDDAMRSLPAGEQDVAAGLFHHLVTPSGMKIAQRVGDLAVYAEASERETEEVLERLAGPVRILRPVGEKSYEIYHDALAGPILDWRTRHIAKREREGRERALREETERRQVELREAQELARAQRRAARAYRMVALALVLGLLGSGVLVVWAVRERNTAERQRNVAREQTDLALRRGVTLSLELAKNGRDQLSTNPALSVLLASRALEVARTALAEEVLRKALLQRLGAVLPAGSDIRFPFPAPVFTRDGGVLLTWSLKQGGVQLWGTATGEPIKLPGDRPHLSATMVPVSPDGRLVVTDGGADAWVSAVATRKRVAVLKGESDLGGADFSADGRLVATIGRSGGIRVWVAETGRRVADLRVGQVYGANFGPSETILASRSLGRVDLWDAVRGRLIAHFPLPGAIHPTSAVPSADGRRLRTRAPSDAAVWDVSRRTVLLRDTVDTLRFPLVSTDGTVALSPEPGGLGVFDVSGPARRRLALLTPAVESAALSPDGRLVATGHARGILQLWEAKTGRRIARFGSHNRKVTLVTFGPDARLLLSATADGTARLWDVQQHRRLATLFGHTKEITRASFSADGRLVATQSDDGTTRVWRTAGVIRPTRSFEAGGRLAAAAFTPDAAQVVTARADGAIELWDVGAGRGSTLDAAGPPVREIGVSPDGRFASAIGDDGLVRVWRLRDGRLVARVQRNKRVLATAVAPRGKLVATAVGRGAVRLRNPATNADMTVPYRKSGLVTALAFSRDGRLLAIGDENGVHIWAIGSDRQPRALLPQVGGGGVTSISFSADRQHLVATTYLGDSRIWKLAADGAGVSAGPDSAALVRSAEIRRAGFSGDGDLVAGWGSGRFVRLWGSRAHLALDLVRTSATPAAAAFGPDGRLAVAGLDGTIRVYACAPCGPISAVRAQASKHMKPGA